MQIKRNLDVCKSCGRAEEDGAYFYWMCDSLVIGDSYERHIELPDHPPSIREMFDDGVALRVRWATSAYDALSGGWTCIWTSVDE